MTPILLLAAVLAAADTPPSVRVDRDNQQVMLEIELDREVQPYATGDSGEAGLVRSVPDWPWHCTLSDLARLTCRAPSDAVPMATPFRIELIAPLYDRRGERLPALVLEGDTGAPEIWFDVRWGGDTPHLVARADQPIDPVSLQALLRLMTMDGADAAAVEVTALPPELQEEYDPQGDEHSFELRLHALTPGARYQLQLDPGLRSLAGPLPGTGESKPYAIEAPGPMYLEFGCGKDRWDQITPPCDPQHGAYLRFHGRPDAASLAALIERLKGAGLQPAEELEQAWGGGYGPRRYQLNLDGLESRHNYRIVVPPLRDAAGLPAREIPELRFKTRVRQPRITMEPAVALAPASPQLWLAGIRRPELTQTWLDADGDRHQLKSRPWRWRAPADPMAFPLPAAPIGLDAAGGVEWLRAGQSGSQVMGMRLHAPFAMHVLRDGEHTWVWLTRWQDATPLAGAQVDTVRVDADGTLQAIPELEATSDAHGMAQLALPNLPYWRQGERDRWLRARRDGQTVYFPLPLAESLGQNEYSYGSDWRQGELRAFVLTDKPIYRPGERVRFQAWLRRRDGLGTRAQRLPASVQIAIQSSWGYGDEPASQDFAVAAGGIVTGEIKLPDHVGDELYGWSIGVGKEDIESTSTVVVSRGEPLTLAVDISDPPAQLRPATEVELAIAAAYFSGGAAAGLEVGARGIIRPGFADEVFPGWAGYTFANGSSDPLRPGDCPDNDRDLARTAEFAAVASDTAGHAKVRGAVRFSCDFGIVEIAAHASLPGLNAAYGPTRRLPLRADREYLGVRVQPASDDQPQRRVYAIALDRDGQPRAGSRVGLQIEQWQDARWQPPSECALVADGVDSCPLAAGASVRIKAQSGTARPVTLEDWDWRDAPLERPVLHAHWDGERLRFQAPQAGSGSALLSIEQGKVVFARVLHWEGGAVKGELDTTELPAGDFDLALLVMPVADAQTPHPVAQRLRTRVAGRVVAAAPSLSLQGVGADREPSRTQRLKLHNRSSAALDVALTVVDQGLVALALEFDAERDPASGEWARALADFETLSAISISRLQPGQQSTGIDVRRNLLRVDGAVADADTVSMESVEVTGSRILADDVYMKAPVSEPGRRGPETALTLADALRRFEPVVRRRFSVQAHWQTGLHLAPGEEREIEIHLPDNLTAWRVEAVAFAADGHAERQLLTLASARSLEVRLSLPAVVIAGDRVQAGASVYNGSDRPVRAAVELHWLGPVLKQSLLRELPLAARGTGSIELLASTPQAGSLQLLAAARAGVASDAALVDALVAAPTRTRSASDSWWLAAGQLQSIDLSAQLGADSLEFSAGLSDLPMLPLWSRRMRDYPHRCYEQIQSRALVAALLRQARPDLASWVDDEIIAAPWRERAGFLDGNGLPVYFDPLVETADDFLPAYTTSVAVRLVELGQTAAALADASLENLGVHLADAAGRALDQRDWSLAAINLRALRSIGKPDDTLEARWWSGQPQFRPISVALALELLAAKPDAVRRQALMERIDTWEAGRDAVPPQTWTGGHFIDNSAAAHCTLVAALAGTPGEQTRACRWFGGVASQFGDAVGNDSLALAACVDAALRLSQALREDREQALIELRLGDQHQQLRLDSAQPRVQLPLRAEPGATRLQLLSDVDLFVGIDATSSIDVREATAQSLGASLTRTLEVRRGEHWEAAPARLKRGDWVRVRLLLETPRAMEMLALEESVPGALLPIDTSLEAVADPWIREQDRHTPWFFARQLGQPTTRFYATWLPAGRHELSYIAEVRHAGEYAWLPAVLAPMYGRVQRAETAAVRLLVEP